MLTSAWHRPLAYEKKPGPDGKNIVNTALTTDPYPTWQKLEELVEKGKIRNIGLSKCVPPPP